MRRSILRFDDGTYVKLEASDKGGEADRFVNMLNLSECSELSNIHVEVSDGLAVYVSGEFDLDDNQSQVYLTW